MTKLKLFLINNYILLIFLISFASAIGSLFFSEVYNLDPCKLCWYQRVFMYPVAIISAVSLVFKAQIRKVYILALTIPGMIMALYQYINQMTLGKSNVEICSGSVSCTFIDFRILGFITIPFLSFLAFLLINLIVLLAYRFNTRNIPVEQ